MYFEYGKKVLEPGDEEHQGKIRVWYEGQPCRKCGTKVVKRTHAKGWEPRRGQPYYFEWWLKCPNPKCKTIYMVDEAKRLLRQPTVDEQFKARLEREP